MGKRSPVLGYNHNFKHRGLIFHVQTEDSGVDNPHLFTHLFYGGAILSSRQIDYDAESEVEVVKGLMQSQHKAVLKDLKIGTFDNKIDAYLGNREDLEPRKPDSAAGPAGEDTDPTAEAHLADMESLPAPEMINLDAPAVEDPEGLTFDAMTDSRAMRTREPINIKDEAASTDEMPSISLRASDEAEGDDTEPGAEAGEDGQVRDMVAEAHAAAEKARELAAQAAAEAAHARELQEAAAAATARAAELEAMAAEQSKSGAHSTGAHSGSIPLAAKPGTQPPMSFDTGKVKKARVTRSGPIADAIDGPPRRRHLPTATEMPAQSEDTLGDPTVTFSSGGGKPKPAVERGDSQSELQAVPQQITGERSGTYSMKRQSPTQRVPRRSGGTQRRGRTGSNPVIAPRTPTPARGSRRAATGKAANPEPGRPRSPVVVSRPAVIIGAPPKMVGKGGGRRPAPRKQRGGSVFGKDLISEKSLDEVIMAYLSEDSSEE